jgi:hypothetical protein
MPIYYYFKHYEIMESTMRTCYRCDRLFYNYKFLQSCVTSIAVGLNIIMGEKFYSISHMQEYLGLRLSPRYFYIWSKINGYNL